MPDSNDLKSLDSQLKKTLISAESFKKGSSINVSKSILNVQKTFGSLIGNVRQLVASVVSIEKIVNNNSKKITILKNISRTQSSIASGENIGAKLPGSSTSNVEDSIATITKSVTSIAEILAGRKKTLDNAAAFDRRKAEQEKRGLAEDKLEKRFEGLKSEAEKVISPVKSILDKIIDFFVTVFLGRVVYKLLEWFGDPKNADKVKAIGRFLGDHWPKLLALYITFGTSFGRFALGLTKVVARGAVSLLSKILLLSKAKKLRAAGKFLGGGKGRGLAGVLGTGVALGGAYAVTQGLKGDGEDQKTQGLAGGGFVIPKISRFSGGGLNFKGMLGGMFAKPQEMSSGFVSGEKGVDKVPAMLTDGEFVMSTGAVQKYGVDTLEGMNAAGGGTNKPKIMNGTTYAAGGGSIGSERYDLTPGFRGESSKSDIYLVRAVNELIKVLRNKFPDSGSSGSSGGSGLPKQLENISNQIISGGSQLYQGAASAANRGYSLASRVAGAAAEKAKPAMSLASRVAGAAAEKAKPAIQSLPSTIDYGSLYLRSQLGGLGGSITESDLSNQTQDEYKKAFARAKADSSNRMMSAQSVVNQYQQLLKAPNLTADQKKDFNNKLSNAKGELAKYKKGLVNVEYSDFKDEKGRLSPAAEAAQKTLGAVWASQEKDGGIKIAKEPYDFPLIKDPIGLMRWKQLNEKEKIDWLNKQNPSSAIRRKLDPRNGGSFGKWGKQDIAEAMYTLNPFATPVETDVKIGGKPRPKGILDKVTNMLDNPLLSMGRGLGMNLLKGKERNVVTGEAEKGSFLDKLFPKSSVTPNKSFYGPGGDPTGTGRGQTQQAQIAKSKPKNVRGGGVKPSAAPKPKVVYGPPAPKKRNVRGGGSSTKTPSFSASNPNAHRSKQETLGLMR